MHVRVGVAGLDYLKCLSDCGCTGGVNYWSDNDIDDYKPDTSSEGALSDCESLCELKGDDLEHNLKRLQAEADLEAPRWTAPIDTLFKIILRPKTNVVWKKAEQNRSLGYNGLSSCTQCQRDKLARDQAE
ncbi:uncharacterized protein F5147DRAFT_578876 [Suillus discolor]|uniref:Uncharacterized protein n=1 Tax=Suillus discolor TaxID=1912936 RepID=A0A9P7F4C9_9AGAM|nr:uncharacterized protein F5147DRAFT_578876 [Suillus discolor]KAG2106534.1 hypothetical protein F5147DRAFT_578876 [Suillus discolor]